MKLVTTQRAVQGEKTEVTLEMSAEEFGLFQKARAEGKLEQLGITDKTVVQILESPEGKKPWAERQETAIPKDIDRIPPR